MKKTYPAWIDAYAHSVHQALSGMTPFHYSSLNGFLAIRSYQGAFLSRIHEALASIQQAGASPAELFGFFAHPSSLRSALMYLIWEYRDLDDKEPYREKSRYVFNALAGALEAGMKGDEWSIDSNRVHSPETVERILRDTPWTKGSTEAARDAGKLYVSLASHAFALYRDFFPQEAHEIFGPYDASASFGEGTELIVKYFPKIRPTELWPEVAQFPYTRVRIYQVLKGAHFQCQLIGMHSLYDGPVVPNTVALAVEADGRFLSVGEICATADTVARRATEYSELYEALDLASAKRKFADWEAYQYAEVFKVAGMDWHPTDAILEPLMQADIPMGFAVDSWPAYEEYVSSPTYEVYWLRDLYRP